MRTVFLVALFVVCVCRSHGQGLLDRRITLQVRRQPLSRVLDTVAARGGFAFSYNSTILPGDSLVSAGFSAAPIHQILEALLGPRFQYVQRDGYVIITRQAAPPTVFVVTGYVTDATTGAAVPNASVYERVQLVTTLTDSSGFFRLRLKERYGAQLIVSKEWYEDTAIYLVPDGVYRLSIRPVPVTEITPLVIAPTFEHSWWGRLFLGSRERIQSLNLVHFFTDKPYQVSLLPTIGTQGRMGSQVTNTVSLNVIGGYSAGTHGVELAGVFNLDRRAVRHVQAAGVLNVAGGRVSGVQAAGVVNRDMDTVDGFVAAGLANIVTGPVRGVQAAGLFNICRGRVQGLQVSSLYNHAGCLRGVQIGLINIADTSSGYSIGLISLVRHGVHQLSLSYEEGYTVTYRSGSPALYSIVLAGYAPDGPTLGYGVGRAFPFSGRWGMIAELTAQQVYDPKWNEQGAVYRFSPSLTFRLSHIVSVFAGPRGSLYEAAGPHPRNISPIGADAGILLF